MIGKGKSCTKLPDMVLTWPGICYESLRISLLKYHILWFGAEGEWRHPSESNCDALGPKATIGRNCLIIDCSGASCWLRCFSGWIIVTDAVLTEKVFHCKSLVSILEGFHWPYSSIRSNSAEQEDICENNANSRIVTVGNLPMPGRCFVKHNHVWATV